MNAKMVYALIIYDITNDKRRTKFVKEISKYGIRVQKSAFEVWINHVLYKRMLADLKSLIKDDEDSLRAYHLPDKCDLYLAGQNLQICKESSMVL